MLRFSKVVRTLSLLALMALAACVRPQSHETDEMATFAVDTVKGSSSIAKQVDGFSVPLTRLYNFTACITDLRTKESVKRHQFSISGGTKTINKRTDDSGCLNWSEEIAFNLLSDEKYLGLERKITSEGMQSGVHTVRLAINPWALTAGAAEVVDLDHASIPDGLQTGDESATESVKPLWVSKILIDNSPQTSYPNLTRRFEIFISPSILLRDLRGQTTAYPLSAANLTASIDLIASVSSAGTERAVLIDSSNKELRVVRDGDMMRIEYTAKIKSGNVGTRYQLVLRLNPQNGPKGLTPFQGLFQVGDYAAMTGAANLPVQLADGAFSAEKEIKLVENYTASKTAIGAGAVEPPQLNGTTSINNSGFSSPHAFEISEVKLDYLGVDSETPLKRVVNYRAGVCVTDTSNGNHAATDVDFTIESDETSIGGKMKTIVPTKRHGPSNDGCISWESSIEHTYYDPEQFFLIPIAIKHTASNFTERRVIALNPWDRSLFGVDTRFAQAAVDKVNSRPKIPSRMIADGLMFETVDTRDYSVDEFMNLKIRKTIRIRVPLRVQRHSNVASGKGLPAESIRDGIYLFRALIFAYVRAANGEITESYSPMVGEQSLVRILGGEVKAYVDLTLSDPRLLRSRANLVFEVQPVEEALLSESEKTNLRLDQGRTIDDVIAKNSKLITPTFVGPLWAGEEGGFVGAYPTDITMSGSVKGIDLAQTIRALQGQKFSAVLDRARQSQADYYERMKHLRSLPTILQTSNLDYITLNNEDAILNANPKLAKNNIGLPARGGQARVMAFMNYEFTHSFFDWLHESFKLKAPFTAQDLQDFVDGKKDLDQAAAGRMCMMFMHELNKEALTSPKEALKDCLTTIRREYSPGRTGIAAVFTIDHSLRVFETNGGKYAPTLQPTLNFQIGADVSFGRAKATSEAWGYGFSLAKIATGVVTLIAPEALPVVSAITGVLGVDATFTHSNSEQTQLTEGSGFSSGTSLTMEHINMDVLAKRYETCVAIRINPTYWAERRNLLKDFKVIGPSGEHKLNRGVLICSGAENKKPLRIHEQFYTFAQQIVDGTNLDKGDLGNQPWLLAVRGTSDYVTFMNFLAAKKSGTNDVNEKIEVGGFPLERMNEAYKAYGSHLHAQPGFFTFDPQTQKPTTNPESTPSWWELFQSPI